MTNHLPLNGDRLLQRAATALLSPKPSAAGLIRAVIAEDAPDGTGAGTKSVAPASSRAVDPSQGHGGNNQLRPKDPLLAALLRTINGR